MTTKEATLRAIHEIEDDLTKQVAYFESIGKEYEAKRLYERVTYDREMIRELGHCVLKTIHDILTAVLQVHVHTVCWIFSLTIF